MPRSIRAHPKRPSSAKSPLKGVPGSYIQNCTFQIREGDPDIFSFNAGRLGDEVTIRLKGYVIVPAESPAGQAAILAMEE